MTIYDELDEARRVRWVEYGRDLVKARGAELGVPPKKLVNH